MQIYVRVIDGKVVDCRNSRPKEGVEGWTTAVEIRPLLTNRQTYAGHHFDVTKNPVEIVWGVQELSAEDRKNHYAGLYKQTLEEVVTSELRKELDEFPTAQYDAAVVDAARVEFEAKMTALAAITTHEELDAL